MKRECFLAVATALVVNTGCYGADNCLSKYTGVDLCVIARNAQAEIAPNLPMRVDKYTTIVSIISIGTKISIIGMWDMTRSDIEKSISSGGMSNYDLKSKFNTMTSGYVCSNNKMASFVKLGGSIEYIYKSSDGSMIHNPTVSRCD